MNYSLSGFWEVGWIFQNILSKVQIKDKKTNIGIMFKKTALNQ